LRLRQCRRVRLVAPGRQARLRVVDDLGDLLLGKARREVADRLIAESVPVGHRDAVGVVAVVLLAHGAGADAGPADCIATGGHQITSSFVMSPSATMVMNQVSARTTVKRLRLRSASPDEPTAVVIPPPNMSDRPPPRP